MRMCGILANTRNIYYTSIQMKGRRKGFVGVDIVEGVYEDCNTHAWNSQTFN